MSLSVEPKIVAGLGVASTLYQSSSANIVPPVRSLRRSALWIMSGNMFYAGCQWLQVATIAHLGPSSDVGRYALAAGIAAPLFTLSNLQLRQIQATDINEQHTFGQYLALRLVMTTGAVLSLIGLGCSFAGSAQLAPVLLAIGMFKAIESVSDIYQGRLQQYERMDSIAQSQFAKGFSTSLAFGVMYFYSHSLPWSVVLMAGAQLVTLLTWDKPFGGRTLAGQVARPEWNTSKIIALACRALPLGITMMLLSLYSNVPRFVLERFEGPAGVGIFAAISYISTIGNMLVNAVGTSVCPRLARLANTNRSAFRSLLSKLAVAAGLAGIGGVALSIAFGRPLLYLLYGAEYAAQEQVFIWAMTAAALSYMTSVLGYGATALGRFREQPWAVAASTVTLLIMSWFLIPNYGLTGAAIASVVACFTCLLSYLLILTRNDHAES